MSAEATRFPDAARLRRRATSERRWSNVTFYAGLAILVGAALCAIFAPLIAPYPPNEIDLTARLLPPSTEHVMGTDTFGRDIASRAIYAIRLDLQVIFIITYVPLVIGMVIGAFSGYFGGWRDSFAMRLVDGVIAFPFLVLVIAIVAIAGVGLTGIYVGVLAVGWALYARLTRGEMLVLREQDFMLAARGLGYSTGRIIFRHAMPNLLRSNIVFSAADLVLNLLLLASLSYLGLGVQPPTAELGSMVAEGQGVPLQAWWLGRQFRLTL
jgi:peptide/nickel transport system permease protein